MRLHHLVLGLALIAGCGDDADDIGVAAECRQTQDCNQDVEPPLSCLANFKGGYCGLSGCTANADCPEESLCVTHTDGVSYCFRACTDKAQCNENRSSENEANCSSNITRVEASNLKACVPPSGT